MKRCERADPKNIMNTFAEQLNQFIHINSSNRVDYSETRVADNILPVDFP